MTRKNAVQSADARTGMAPASVPPRVRGRLLAAAGIAAAIAVALAACAGEGTGAPERTGAPSAAPDTAAVDLPFDFVISLYQGESVLGGSELKFSELLAPGKPVVLNMWAGLCPPCRAELPDFQEIYDDSRDEIVLLGLDIGAFTGLGNRDDALALVEQLGITFPVGATNQVEVMSAYRVLAMPSTYFIRPDGTILESWSGPIDAAGLRDKVAALVAASGGESPR